MLLKISEIFYSIQGEGFHSGRSAIFVRLAGCNLSCRFCDTEHNIKSRLSTDNILEHCKTFPSKFVVITGGEPTLQSEGLNILTRQLQQAGYFVAVETNGTTEMELSADWVTVSPKPFENGIWRRKSGAELKVLFYGQDLVPYETGSFEHYFIQPIFPGKIKGTLNDQNISHLQQMWQKSVEWVKFHPNWKLSLQLHKILNIS